MTRCKDNLFFIKKNFEEKKCFRDRLEKRTEVLLPSIWFAWENVLKRLRSEKRL